MGTANTSPAGSVGQEILKDAGPAIASAIPTLANAFVTLIASVAAKHSSAAQATKAPGTGPVVFGDVVLATMNDLIKAHAAGQLPGAIPDQATVAIIVQAVYTVLNLPTSAPVPAVQGTTVKAGQTLTITGVA